MFPGNNWRIQSNYRRKWEYQNVCKVSVHVYNKSKQSKVIRSMYLVKESD